MITVSYNQNYDCLHIIKTITVYQSLFAMTSFRDKPTTNLFAATIFRKQEVDYVEKIIPDPFIY